MIGGLHAPPVVPPSPLMQVWLIPLSVKRSTRPESSKLFTQARESPWKYLPGSPQFPENRQGTLTRILFLLAQLSLCSQAQEECRTGVTNADERVLSARATQ
jgi:hypothetical protein